MRDSICQVIGTTNLCAGCGAAVPHYSDSCEPCPVHQRHTCGTVEEVLTKIYKTRLSQNGTIETLNRLRQRMPEFEGAYTKELHQQITNQADNNTWWQAYRPLDDQL